MTNTQLASSDELKSNKLKIILRKLIAEAGMNDLDLARALNMPNSTLNQLLKADHLRPRIDTLIPIAKYFNVSIEQLIGERPLGHKTAPAHSSNTVPKSFQGKWEQDLFVRCLEKTSQLMKQNHYQADAEQVIAIIREAYFFSLNKKDKEVDPSFIEWLFENN